MECTTVTTQPNSNESVFMPEYEYNSVVL